MKSLLRVVAEQSEIRPSLTSLTSFTSNIDLEDVYCSNYSISGATNIHCNTVKTPGGKILQDGSFHGENIAYIDNFIRLAHLGKTMKDQYGPKICHT